MNDYVTHTHTETGNSFRITHTHLMEDEDHGHDYLVRPTTTKMVKPKSEYDKLYGDYHAMAEKFSTRTLDTLLGRYDLVRSGVDRRVNSVSAYDALIDERKTRE